MKRIVLIAVFLVSISQISFGQSLGKVISEELDDCGSWVVNETIYTNWEPVDTLSNKKIISDIRKWVYSKENRLNPYALPEMPCPCGCGYDEQFIQYRICEITGIRQSRTKTLTFVFVPMDKTKYCETVQKFINKH